MAQFSPINQFGSAGQLSSSRDCLPFEAMLADAVDGVLSPADQAAFDQHLLTCAGCRQMLADATRGVAWLEMLRLHRPEPPDDLVDRILAQTSVRAAQEIVAERAVQREAAVAASLLGRPALVASHQLAPGAASAANVLPFQARSADRLRRAVQTAFQPRYAMTAAMAFFSMALTLNLTGIHLTALRARDLRPAAVQRSFYEANAHVIRYYENLRVVYELEARIRDLQRTGDADAAPRPAAKDAVTPEQKDDAPAAQPAPGAKPRSSTSGANGVGRESRVRPEAESGRHDAKGAEPHLAPRPSAPDPLGTDRPGASLSVSFPIASPAREKRGLV